MTGILSPPAARLGLLALVGLVALAAVFGVVGAYHQPPDGQSGSLAGAIAAQDLRFWVQIVTGLGAFVIAAWVWALKPRDPDVGLFALSGLATLTFTFAYIAPGAVDVSLPPGLLDLLFRLNFIGAVAFGIVMPVLLMRYPARLPGYRVLTLAVVGVFGIWSFVAVIGPLERLVWGYMITFLEMLCICAAVIAQFFATRSRPTDHAIAVWLGVSVLVGSGIFIALIAAPAAFGYPPFVDERYAFSSFLLIYIGLAVGLTRYRLFELGEWAFYVLFYVVGALILLAIDLVLVVFISVDARVAFGAALLLVALAYLPARDWLWRRFLQIRRLDEHELIQSVIDVAFEPAEGARHDRWRALFGKLFDPLEISAGGDGGEAAVRDDGTGLFVPATAHMPAMVLRYPWRGRSLFGPRHLRTARRLVDVMQRAEAGRHAYDLGVAEERARIARDMHDNIGSQLLSALHSPALERKNLMIGQTLSDLRDIIRNATRPGLPLEEALADLRAETAERLEPTDIVLRWSAACDDDAALSPDAAHALRSLVREATSNIIRHAEASRADVSIDCSDGDIRLKLSDDGGGFDPDAVTDGTGLNNMQARAEALGGDFELSSGASGTDIQARLPYTGRRAVEATTG